MPDLADSPDPLASPPRWCPECGYAMLGLPAAGRCPECGWGYDADTVVLYGRALTDSNAVENYPAPDLGVMLVVLLVVGVVLTIALLNRGSAWGVVATWVILGGIGASIYNVRRTRWGMPVQFRLTPAGFGARRGFGKVRLRPWGPEVEVVFRHLTPASWAEGDRPSTLLVAAVEVRRPARPGRFSVGLPSGGAVAFEADWSTLDRLARRVLAWRAGG